MFYDEIYGKTGRIFLFILILGALVLAGCSSNGAGVSDLGKLNGVVTVFKSQSCGCCDAYASYLRSQGVKVETVQIDDMSVIKTKYGIPSSMESCHTSVIGDYFVEGHMPVEAYESLMNEKPAIDGIALPGMPSGSPGMPGSKREQWKVYSLSNGEVSEFKITKTAPFPT